jgi:nitroreductase
MDTLSAILSRRSIRKFTKETVSDQIITELLEVAMSAPSAGNERPWHFIVIRDRRILDAIPKYHPYSQSLTESSVAIMVCGDPQLEQYEGCMVQDLSAATENILIAVQAKGLGAVWLGLHPVKERIDGVRKLLNIPRDVIPLCVIPIGYPAEQKPPANRYDQSRIHHDKW